MNKDSGSKVLATIVLLAGLPGRVDIARRMASVLGEELGYGNGVFLEPVEGEPAAPIPEASWRVRFVVNIPVSEVGRITITDRKVEVV